jgi:hypothetical protein
MFNIQLRFHEDESWYPCYSDYTDGYINPLYWKHSEDYMFNGKKYKCVDYIMYYKENGAIGLGGFEYLKYNSKLGYHNLDAERIRILHDGAKPLYIYVSAHAQEGTWGRVCNLDGTLASCNNSKDCNYVCAETDGNYIVVYVAKWSHAMYLSSGTRHRIFLSANDTTSKNGKKISFDPSRNMNLIEVKSEAEAKGINSNIQNREVIDILWKRLTLPLWDMKALKDRQIIEQNKLNNTF